MPFGLDHWNMAAETGTRVCFERPSRSTSSRRRLLNKFLISSSIYIFNQFVLILLLAPICQQGRPYKFLKSSLAHRLDPKDFEGKEASESGGVTLLSPTCTWKLD